jgi:hypothetical protein
MTTANKTVAAYAFAGKGKVARELAMAQIAPLSFAEDTSRAASLDNMRKVLGNTPSEPLRKAARIRWIIGRVASRLPVNELPRGKTSAPDRLEYAEKVVTLMQRPAEGQTVGTLQKGKIGRRSAMQQRVVRAAEEAASLFFAELGLGKARTQGEKNAKQKRKVNQPPVMAGSGKGKAATPPTYSQLVKPAAPVTADDAVTHCMMQSQSLIDYAKKYAGVMPAGFAAAIERFRTDCLAEDKVHHAAKAAAMAKPAKPAKRAAPAKLVAVK